MSSKEIDCLTEDSPIINQNYVCLSFVSPEGIKGCSIRALKVRGVFQTYEKAQERAKEIQESDPDFNVFIGEVGKWLPWDPAPHEGAKDQIYYEKEMQDLVSGYKENIKNSKKEVLDRAEACKTARLQNKSSNPRKNKVVERLHKKLEKSKNNNAVKDIESNLANEEIDEMNKEVESYNKYVEDMTFEQKMKKIEELSKQ